MGRKYVATNSNVSHVPCVKIFEVRERGYYPVAYVFGYDQAVDFMEMVLKCHRMPFVKPNDITVETGQFLRRNHNG